MSPEPTTGSTLASSWPPKSLCTVIVPAPEAICPVHASARISASASLVFSTLLDTSTYPQWNSWCPRVTIHSQPKPHSESASVLQKDTHFTFHVIMDASKPTKVTDTQLRVSDMSTPERPSDYVPASLLEDPTFTADLRKVYRVAWTIEGGIVTRGLRSERFHEIVVLGESECEVRSWECLGGVLARTVKWLHGKTLMEKFQLWVDDLRRECERRAAEEGDNAVGRDGGERD